MMIYQGSFKVGFGNYEGLVIDDIIKLNSHYILWCIINLHHFSINAELFLDNNLKKENNYLEALEINMLKLQLLWYWQYCIEPGDDGEGNDELTFNESLDLWFI